MTTDFSDCINRKETRGKEGVKKKNECSYLE